MGTRQTKTREGKASSLIAENLADNGKSGPEFHFENKRSDHALQMKIQDKAINFSNQKSYPVQRKENKTGLPDQLKSGIENLSGYSMDDVQVHYNSNKPSQLQAHAYAQGTDIHVASGQEKHLAHEAWHVVQQKQGRVQATRQLKSKVNINDDPSLEKEADVMGQKALQMKTYEGSQLNKISIGALSPVQRIKIQKNSIPSAVWANLSRFDGFEWEEIDTDKLDPDEREAIKQILIQAGQNALADEIVTPEERPVNLEALRSGLRIDPASIPRRESVAPSDRYIQVREETGPVYPRLNAIWNHIYDKRHKIYKGTPQQVQAVLLNDPAVKAIFNPPKDILALLGWNVMCRVNPDVPDFHEISLDLAFFEGKGFNVQARFPCGMQDTSMGYTSHDEGESFELAYVHRHRSMKSQGAPDNVFTGMIAEQASGVAKQGGRVTYDSDAIRSGEGWGYNVWPKHGFDAPVPADSLRDMKADNEANLARGVQWLNTHAAHGVNFAQMFQVRDATIYRELSELWRKHGHTVNVVFDATPHSNSWMTLARYAHSKNMNLVSPNFVELTITGITHLVEIKGNSIYEGKEGPELRHGQRVIIDPHDKYRSRRGPNQEIHHERDGRSQPIYRWFRVIAINGVLAGRGLYLRDQTFVENGNLNQLLRRPAQIAHGHRNTRTALTGSK